MGRVGPTIGSLAVQGQPLDHSVENPLYVLDVISRTAAVATAANRPTPQSSAPETSPTVTACPT